MELFYEEKICSSDVRSGIKDDMTALLIQNDGRFPEEPADENSEIPDKPDDTKRTNNETDTQTPPEKPQDDREHYSVETPFETRYFTVTADEDGEITDCDLERIAAVDEDTAEEYAKKISAKSGETGFEGIYRYRVTETDDGIKYVFLDCRREISNFRTVLVTLSRLDEEKGLQDIAEFNLSEAIADSVQPYEVLAQTKEKNLVLEIEKNIFYAGDEKSVRQLTGILMDNAVKYSSEKGNIRLILKKKGKKILLEVYNDAEKLPQGKLDVLFERFYRLDSSRNSGTGGSGIGLSVAKAIVQAHKGKITAENKNGKGLTITILL